MRVACDDVGGGDRPAVPLAGVGLALAGPRAGGQPPADLAAHDQRKGGDVQPDLPRSPHEHPGQLRVASVEQRPGEHQVQSVEQRGALGGPVRGGRPVGRN